MLSIIFEYADVESAINYYLSGAIGNVEEWEKKIYINIINKKVTMRNMKTLLRNHILTKKYFLYKSITDLDNTNEELHSSTGYGKNLIEHCEKVIHDRLSRYNNYNFNHNNYNISYNIYGKYPISEVRMDREITVYKYPNHLRVNKGKYIHLNNEILEIVKEDDKFVFKDHNIKETYEYVKLNEKKIKYRPIKRCLDCYEYLGEGHSKKIQKSKRCFKCKILKKRNYRTVCQWCDKKLRDLYVGCRCCKYTSFYNLYLPKGIRYNTMREDYNGCKLFYDKVQIYIQEQKRKYLLKIQKKKQQKRFNKYRSILRRKILNEKRLKEYNDYINYWDQVIVPIFDNSNNRYSIKKQLKEQHDFNEYWDENIIPLLINLDSRYISDFEHERFKDLIIF